MLTLIRIAWYQRFTKKIPDDYHQILSHYNDYYNGLSEPLKAIFRKRIYISIKFIEFEPVEFQYVTLEMKVLITSALVQITFGLEKFVLKRFRKIFVVPNTYSFAQYPALLGHVDHEANVIAMSWPSVKEGFVVPDDAMNVALHEITHALQGEDEESFVFDNFFEEVNLENWKAAGLPEIYKIRAKRHELFRDYAGQNMDELFAVCMECFFEQPQEFKEKVPRLYALMVKLLNQDPTHRSNPLRI